MGMKQNSICTRVLRLLTSNVGVRGALAPCVPLALGSAPFPHQLHNIKSSQVSQVMRSMEERCRRKLPRIVAETCSFLLIFHCYFLQYNAAGELGEKDLSCSDF